MNAPCFLTFLLCIHNLLVMFFFQAMDEKILITCFNFRKLNIVLRSSVSTKMVRCFHVTVTLKFSNAHNERETILKQITLKMIYQFQRFSLCL